MLILAGTIAVLFLLFQLPLSGSRISENRVKRKFGSLSTPSLGITYRLSGKPRPQLRLLSTPSLGITRVVERERDVLVPFNSLSRDHEMKLERGLVWGYDPFQLPLSGSQGTLPNVRVSWNKTIFQLPLSGSQEY